MKRDVPSIRDEHVRRAKRHRKIALNEVSDSEPDRFERCVSNVAHGVCA
jgi:hypothetical protein